MGQSKAVPPKDGMRRREFSILSGAAAFASARPALAQKELPLVAVLIAGSAKQADDRVAAIRLGLKEAGLTEGVNYAIALRFADGVLSRLPELVAELAALKPRVIVSVGVAPVVPKVAPDLPHVFTAIADDPVRMGLVESFARPGGNATGNVMTALGGEDTMAQKRVGLFKELVPNFRRLGFIGTTSVLPVTELNALRGVAGHFGFELVHHPIQGADDIERAIAATNRDGVDALYVSGAPEMYTQMARVAPLVVASGKPSFGTYPDWARAGLLMSYASDIYDGVRRAGLYVAKILRGEKPGDIPIEQASRFFLVLNARTAQQLGIRVPPTFLPDEVVE
jgi:putative ABC transport system substrate-binding protein